MNRKVTITGAKPYEADIQVSAQTNVPFAGADNVNSYNTQMRSRLFTISVVFQRLPLLTVSSIPEGQLEQTLVNIEAATGLYLNSMASADSAPQGFLKQAPIEHHLCNLGYK